MKGKEHRLEGTEGGELYGAIFFSKETIRHQFDSLCKKILPEEYGGSVREARQHMKHEKIFRN